MANLYEMTQEVASLYEMLQDTELTEEERAQIITDHIQGIEADKKVEGYCQIIKQFEADSDMFANEKKRVEERKKVCDNSIKRMKDALAMFLEASGEKKIQSGTFVVTSRTTKSVEITDDNAIANEFLIPQPSKIDKASIKKALSSGEEVAGAILVENKGVLIK